MKRSAEEWQEQLNELRSQRDAAFRSLSQLQASMDQLTQMMASQNDRLDEVVTMLRRREAQLKRAEAENRKLRRRLGLDDDDPEPTPAPVPDGSPEPTSEADEPNEVSAGQDDAATPGAPESSKPRPRSRGGRRPPPEHLPTDKERYDVCACGQCGGRVTKRDVLSIRLYTVVPSYVRCREIQRERVICVDCGAPTTAEMPPMPCERALYDCRFLAWVVVMKFVLLVPLDRIRELLLTQGVDIAMGSLVHLIERAATLVDPIDGEHMKQLRRGPYLCFDGTGLPTIVLGQDKTWDAYFEVFTRDEITVCQFDLTKHADRLKRRIRDFLGVLVCDAETRNRAGVGPDALIANCNAHPLRKLRDAEAVQPKLALQGQRFIQALYELEHEADRQRLDDVARIKFRKERSQRVLDRFKQWLEGVGRLGLPPSDPVGKVARYYLRHWDDLTRFIDHPDLLPLDNNQAEREFQRHAKLRKSSLFAGSPEGGHRWATLFGVVRTAQKCNLDVLDYLTWVFERRGSHRKAFGMAASDLTPMAYRDLIRPAERLAA